MKKILVLALALVMLVGAVACTNNKDDSKPTDAPTDAPATEAPTEPEKPATFGQGFYKAFAEAVKANKDATTQDLADAITKDEAYAELSLMTAPVQEGFLNGFSNEIKGFKEATQFAPMISTIPFMGYIFELEEGADVDAFIKVLKDNANPRWNICTEAEETIVEKDGNKIFFLMAPLSMEG